ncbi:MAG: metallophosphoesterase [Candidatus Micrarchaeota archaeon]|nr:metallophosphoesterase [Candidatus Micrarchaeota archaeon]
MQGDLLFIPGKPAALIKKERVLVIGDLHIGVELKLAREGINFPDASQRLAREINRLCDENRAERILFLGDIKESVGNPPTDEANAIRTFFRQLEDKQIMIAKGNHDPKLADLIGRMGLDAQIDREFFIGNFAAMHGNSWPSEAAMGKGTIISGHIHPIIREEGEGRKVWIVAKAGKDAGKHYASYNKRVRLVIAPAFNELVLGRAIDSSTKRRVPAFANGIFDFESAEIRTIDGGAVGRVNSIV